MWARLLVVLVIFTSIIWAAYSGWFWTPIAATVLFFTEFFAAAATVFGVCGLLALCWLWAVDGVELTVILNDLGIKSWWKRIYPAVRGALQVVGGGNLERLTSIAGVVKRFLSAISGGGEPPATDQDEPPAVEAPLNAILNEFRRRQNDGCTPQSIQVSRANWEAIQRVYDGIPWSRPHGLRTPRDLPLPPGAIGEMYGLPIYECFSTGFRVVCAEDVGLRTPVVAYGPGGRPEVQPIRPSADK